MIAQGLEAAAVNTQSLKTTDSSINRVNGPPSGASGASGGSRDKQPCFHCGRSNHKAADCRFRDSECYKCDKKGHIAPVCRSKHKDKTPVSGRRQARKKPHRTKWVAEGDNEDQSPDELSIHTLEDNSRPLRVEVLLNGKAVSMEVDTGAAVSLISQSKLQTLFPNTNFSLKNRMCCSGRILENT